MEISHFLYISCQSPKETWQNLVAFFFFLKNDYLDISLLVLMLPFEVKQMFLILCHCQVEALAVQLTQREGELIQEKAEVKKLANFLKQVMWTSWWKLMWHNNFLSALKDTVFVLILLFLFFIIISYNIYHFLLSLKFWFDIIICVMKCICIAIQIFFYICLL